MYGAMDDMASRLSAEEMAELSSLADGTLPPNRRAALEARVAASPELQELVDRQRKAVAATKAMASEPAPASLRAAVEAHRRERDTARRRLRWAVPRLAVAGTLAAVAIVVAVALSGGPAGGPTVADAARLAARPPSAPAPPRLDHSPAKLAARVDGVVFPDLLRSYGWRAVGLRRDHLDGRDATVVSYAKGGSRIAYVIVSGPGLARPSGAQTTVRRGVELQTLRLNGQPAVTWQRLGHTCLLTGTSSRGELLTLASWRGRGTLRY
jgi:anti-sigma factor RsiW